MKLEVKLAIVQTVLLGLACLLLAVILIRGSSGKTREEELAQHLTNLSAISRQHDVEYRAVEGEKELIEKLNKESKRLSELILSTRNELFK